MLRSLLTVILGLITGTVYSQSSYASFADVEKAIRTSNYNLKNGVIELEKSEKATLAAKLGILDITGSLNASYTNNSQLPVSLFPGELLGGAPGTYKEVKLGVQYEAKANTLIDLKLVNFGGWANYKLSKINKELQSASNNLQLRDLLEDAAGLYYNLATLYFQRVTLQGQWANADSILKVVAIKEQEGNASKREYEEALLNKLRMEKAVEDILQTERIEKERLAVLMNESTIPEFVFGSYNIVSDGLILVDSTVGLRAKYALLSSKNSYQQLQSQRSQFLPTLSLVQSFQSQRFSTKANMSSNTDRWIPSNYIGLRLSIPVPSTTLISNYYREKYNYKLAANNYQKVLREEMFEAKKIQLQYEASLKKIFKISEELKLRESIYAKEFEAFKNGLLSLNQLLQSFNDVLSVSFDYKSALVQVKLFEEKIAIRNKIK